MQKKKHLIPNSSYWLSSELLHEILDLFCIDIKKVAESRILLMEHK